MEQIILAGPLSVTKESPAAELADIDGLVHAYRSRIFRYALLSLKDTDLAESLTQDCFLKAFNAREQFRGDCSVSTWLIRIASNLIRDYTRTRRFQFWKHVSSTALDVTEIADQVGAPEASPESRLLAKEALGRVWRAVDELSARQRSVFLLRFVEGLEPLEIATATGMSVGTVKSHLHRALQAVRSIAEGRK